MEKEFCNKKVESSITVERHNSLQPTARTRTQTQTRIVARTRTLPTTCLLAIFIQCRCWWWCRCRHLTGHYSKKGRLSRSPNVTRTFRVAQGNAGRWRKGFWVRSGFVWICASASAAAGLQVSMGLPYRVQFPYQRDGVNAPGAKWQRGAHYRAEHHYVRRSESEYLQPELWMQKWAKLVCSKQQIYNAV